MSEDDDRDDLDDVLRLVIHAAHAAALDARRTGSSQAAVVREAVTEAFRSALGNELVALTPRDTWPTWVDNHPPYHRVHESWPRPRDRS